MGQAGYVAGEIHGFIIQKNNITNAVQWYNGVAVLTSATNQGIGNATANTNTIVSVQGSGTYAAKLCYDLVEEGYSDWVLPTKQELEKIGTNRDYFPSFPNYEYWSSSEVDLNRAYKYNWGGRSSWGDDGKFRPCAVRAIRYF